MRVFSKKAYKFEVPGEKPVAVQPMGFKDVPDWVRKTKLFALAAKDGSIHEVLTKSQEIGLENSGMTEEEQQLRDRAKELGIAKWKSYNLNNLKLKIAEAEQKLAEQQNGGNEEEDSEEESKKPEE